MKTKTKEKRTDKSKTKSPEVKMKMLAPHSKMPTKWKTNRSSKAVRRRKQEKGSLKIPLRRTKAIPRKEKTLKRN